MPKIMKSLIVLGTVMLILGQLVSAGLREEKHMAKFCSMDGDEGLQFLTKVITCQKKVVVSSENFQMSLKL